MLCQVHTEHSGRAVVQSSAVGLLAAVNGEWKAERGSKWNFVLV